MADLLSGQALRILLVSPQEELRDEVGQALAGGASTLQPPQAGAWGGYRLYWVSQADLALTRVQDVLPQAILVDDEQGGTDATALIKQLATRAPGTVILALVAPDAMDGASQAVLAGARGFLPKPLRAEVLLATLQQTLGEHWAPPQSQLPEGPTAGRVVVVCAPKGGTGRTTTALNLAVSLRAATQGPVALVDADYAAPSLDVVLNLRSEHNITDLLPRLSGLDEELISGVLSAHASGIEVLLAPPPAGLDRPISLPQVQQILVLLRRMFPWVIVDLGLPLDETAFAFLDGADRIIMTVLPEMAGLRNTRLMINQLRARGYPEEKEWLVLNRSTIRGGVPVHDIEERLKVRVTHCIPDDQPLVTASINRGVPLVLSHRQSAVARAMRWLARQLLADPALGGQPARRSAPTAGGRRGPLGRLLRRRTGGRRTGASAAEG